MHKAGRDQKANRQYNNDLATAAAALFANETQTQKLCLTINIHNDALCLYTHGAHNARDFVAALREEKNIHKCLCCLASAETSSTQTT